MMDWNEYQEWCVSGVLESTHTTPRIIYPALGLGGEAGEFLEKVKKSIRDGHRDEYEMAKELGDILWYLSVCADYLGFELEEVMQMNVDKLNDRRDRNMIQGDGDGR